MKASLVVLGFVECGKVEKLPKFHCITKKFHKLAMVHHPDKPGGNDDVFKKISEAYRLIGEYFEEEREKGNVASPFDYEEEVARQTFQQYQHSKIKENLRSFTILIDNNLSSMWETVLSAHYGDPKDRETNGLHWKIENYSDGDMVGNIDIGKWHMPKKDKQSKLHIQSNEVGNFLPAHFVDHVLPKLFEEVNEKALPNQKPINMVVSSKKLKPKPPSNKCNECDFDAKNLSGLSAHMRLNHRKLPRASTAKSSESLNRDHSMSMESFTAKDDMKVSVEASIHVEESSFPGIESSLQPEGLSIHVEELPGNSILKKDNKEETLAESDPTQKYGLGITPNISNHDGEIEKNPNTSSQRISDDINGKPDEDQTSPDEVVVLEKKERRASANRKDNVSGNLLAWIKLS